MTREEMERDLALHQPIPRAGRPIDIANTAIFLASDEATWVTGSCLVFDGGASAGVWNYAQSVTHDHLVKPGFIGPSFERG